MIFSTFSNLSKSVIFGTITVQKIEEEKANVTFCNKNEAKKLRFYLI